MSDTPSGIPPDVLQAATNLWQRVPGGHTMPIEGNSMRPLLRPGDTVFVAHEADALRPGDIIVFWHGHTPVVHRLIEVAHGPDGPRFVPKGDNVARPDAPIGVKAIIGRVSRVQRGAHRIGLDGPVWQKASRLWAAGQAVLAGSGRSAGVWAAMVRRLMLALSYSIFIPAQWVDAIWRWFVAVIH